MKDYTEIFKLFKELIMEYGLFSVTFCLVLLVLVWRLPAIITALAEFKARKLDK